MGNKPALCSSVCTSALLKYCTPVFLTVLDSRATSFRGAPSTLLNIKITGSVYGSCSAMLRFLSSSGLHNTRAVRDLGICTVRFRRTQRVAPRVHNYYNTSLHVASIPADSFQSLNPPTGASRVT